MLKYVVDALEDAAVAQGLNPASARLGAGKYAGALLDQSLRFARSQGPQCSGCS